MDALSEIRALMLRHSPPGWGLHATPVPRLGLFRADEPSTPTPGVYEPMLCIVVAGRKRGFIRNETLEYRSGDAILVTVDLPIVGTILEASPRRPYLALSVRLHRPTLAAVVLDSEPLPARENGREAGLRVDRAGPELLDAALRLARLLDLPRDIPVLAPLLERENLYRLLTGPWGATMLEISRAESRVSQVSRAVAWLRQNYAEEYSAESVAKVTAMSVSSLNRHFRAVTGMSPLEYHKCIRLQEARRLLLAEGTDVAGVGYSVGYSSTSQFTREYRRLFGEPPGRDAERIRRAAFATG